MDVDLVAASRDVFAGRAHVVLHVAGAKNAARVGIFESGEDSFQITFGHMGDYVEAATVANAHYELTGAKTGTRIEKFIHQRNQRGDAFEREALTAEVSLLHDLLEDVGTDEQVENALLVFLRRIGFHLLVNPTATFGGIDVVDLDTDGAGVDSAGFARVFAFQLQLWRDARAQETEGIEIALEISPLAEGAEDSLAFEVGAVGSGAINQSSCAGSLGFRGSHKSPLLG